MEKKVLEHKQEEKEKEYSTSFKEDDDEILKKKISCHSLYGLMLDTHLDCLKMCLGNEEINCMDTKEGAGQSCITADQLELDQFMEAYCNTLKKLKEAMEETQKESMEFINYMHFQLKELVDHKSSGNSREVG